MNIAEAIDLQGLDLSIQKLIARIDKLERERVSHSLISAPPITVTWMFHRLIVVTFLKPDKTGSSTIVVLCLGVICTEVVVVSVT